MKKPISKSAAIWLSASLLSLQSVSAFAQVITNWDWAYSQYFVTGSPPSYINTSICLDTAGNIVTGGEFQGGTLIYGSSIIGTTGSVAHSEGDYLQFDSAANLIGTFAGPYSDSSVIITKIITDKNNDLYITGTFQGQYFHPPAPLLYNTHFYYSDIFLEKVNLNTGAGVWAKSAGGTYNDYASDMCVDSNSNIYMTGYFTSNFIAFGTDTVRGSGTQFFITKYNSAGNVVWAKGGTSHNYSQGNKISTGNDGFLYVTGTFTDTFSFGGDTVIDPASGPQQTFLAKIDTNGNLIWLKWYNGNSSGSIVACNSRHEVYFTGDFGAATMNLGTHTLNNAGAGGNPSIFLSKIDSGGNVMWAQSFGGTYAGSSPGGIAVDKYDNGYLTGYTDCASIVCGSDTVYNSYPYNPVGFVFKFDSLGHIIYTKSANASNSSSYITPNSIAVNNRGDVYITGVVRADTVLFGSILMQPLTEEPFYTSFIAKIDSVPNCTGTVTATSATTFCVGDSVIIHASGIAGTTWQWFQGTTLISGATSSNYTALSNGVYSVNITNSYGCVAAGAVTVSVNPLPVAGTISGFSTVCAGSTITLTDATSGGVWSSSNTTIATAGTGGIFTGAAAGIDTARYSVTNTCGTAIATYLFTIDPTPALTGTLTATTCDSAMFTYVPGSTMSGTSYAWGRAFVTGISNAAATGSGSISESLVNVTYAPVAVVYIYTLSAAGCTNTGDVTVTVNPLPFPGTITGSFNVCTGAAVTLSDAVSGGSWSATNGNALVSGVGVMHGFSAGVDTIKYTVTNTCGSSVANAIVTVEPMPNAGTLTGPNTVCVNDTIMLSDGVTGGAWSDADGDVFISAGGVVLGVAAGTDVVSYTVTNSCGSATATHAIVIDPLPVAGTIAGTDSVCVGETIALTDVATGGAWSASNANVLVSGTGGVHGLVSGTVDISYSVTNSCGTATATFLVNVKDCNTGVANIASPLQDVSIFPNPAQTQITVTSTYTINQLEITDLLGRAIYSEQYNSTHATIDVSALSAAVYLIKVNNTIVRKFVKE